MNNPNLKYWDYKYYYWIHCKKCWPNATSYQSFMRRINRWWMLKDAIYTPQSNNITKEQRANREKMINDYLENFTPKMNYDKEYHQKISKERKNYYNFKPKKTRREKIKERFHKFF